MDQNTLNSILGEFAESLQRPACEEITVKPEAIKARVAEMAKRGYLPTEAGIRALEKYLQGYGLWLSGDVGTGKTAFFRNLRPMNVPTGRTQSIPRIVIFPMVRSIEMSVEEIREFLDDNHFNELVLDDLGAEPIFNHFGGKFDILPYILDKRMESPCRTHATSNLTIKAMAVRYQDARILDRFAEMFTKVVFSGPSLRRSAPNASIRAAQMRFIESQRKSEEARQESTEKAESGPSRTPGERDK